MRIIEDFKELINEDSLSKEDGIILGGALLEAEALSDAHVKIPLKTSLSDTK